MKGAMLAGLTNDVEYLSEYPIEARYYEDWDEWIEQTCSEPCNCTTDEDGYTSCDTCYYDCSYRDYHPEYWEIITNTGYRRSISESYFNYLTKLWSNKTFVNMHRDYYRDDGDMYKTKFDGKFEHLEPRTFKQIYENKAQAATNIFKFQELDSLEKADLYSYPEIYGRARQINCLGCPKEDNLYLERHNALLGKRFQVKMFILSFENKSIEVSERQRVLWKGGNMNELIVCVDKNGKWAKSFSWCDNKMIEAQLNEIFLRDISLRQKIDLMQKQAQKNWKRKDFAKDFDYIDVPLKPNQLIWIYAIVFMLSSGILVFGVLNDIEQGDF